MTMVLNFRSLDMTVFFLVYILYQTQTETICERTNSQIQSPQKRTDNEKKNFLCHGEENAIQLLTLSL